MMRSSSTSRRPNREVWISMPTPVANYKRGHSRRARTRGDAGDRPRLRAGTSFSFQSTVPRGPLVPRAGLADRGNNRCAVGVTNPCISLRNSPRMLKATRVPPASTQKIQERQVHRLGRRPPHLRWLPAPQARPVARAGAEGVQEGSLRARHQPQW